MKKIFFFILMLSSFCSFSQSTTIVISQLYGGGGGSTGTYLHDYVELHNVSGTTQSLTGMSLQYGSATGNFGSTATNIYAFPAGTSIPAGGFLLVQLSAAGSAGAPLPVTPDLITTNLTMSGASGKVALANQTASLGCGTTPCTLPSATIIDLVAYGTANNAEGGAAANGGVALTSTQGLVRKLNGCQDTDNNNSDFTTVTAPTPRNSSSTPVNCGVVPASLTVTGTLNNFGSVAIGSSSASQSYSLSGSNLTGAPGTITVTAPAEFEVSLDNSIFSSSVTIPYSSATLAATTVYVRFTPQSAGIKTGNVTNSGGGVTTPVNVAVSGTGTVPVTPVLSSTTLTGFGNVCVNSTAGPNSFTVSGLNLSTANITVGPLTGYSFSTTAGGTYTSSLTLTQPGGTFSQQVFVKFTPTAAQSYNGNIVVSGGGASSVNVSATGAGNNNPPAVITGSASAVTTTSVTLSGSISSNGCTAVTAYGFEYSLTSGFINGTVVPSTNVSAGVFTAPLTSLAPATTYYFKAFATNGGGTSYGTQSSFTTAVPVLTATPLTAFGSICVNTESTVNSFTISSTGLGTSNVTVGPRAGFTFSTSATGPFTNSLSIVQPGGAFNQTVYVKFTPTATQNYSGNIPVGGGSATTINVAASGTGANLPPTATTSDAVILSPNSAVLTGDVSTAGCSPVSERGFEYTTIPGLANGLGTRVRATNLNPGAFSYTLTGLIPATTYYFKSYVKNDGGISFGPEKSFTTSDIPAGLVIYSSPVQRGTNMRFSLKDIRPNHYTAKIFNSVGQLVAKKEIILQVNFIDDLILIPGYLPIGRYTLMVESLDFSTKASFMVK